MRVEGTARLWKSRDSVKINIPKDLFLLLTGLSKKDAKGHGLKGYIAVTREGCVKIAISRAPPEWAQYTVSLDRMGLLYLPRMIAKSMGFTPGVYRIVVEVSEDDRYAILCPRSQDRCRCEACS